ncbi:alpha/beta fold hydrolase [Rhodococcus sp. APC 3903]|uniref:alpha/beta fold hydrolase n=1 Tax=Rhodococcus sp. APC 3903 TaxID=3035193 RepID=UPI0025B31FEC|nr:alpha/beta fold hydrolase [Rhodococcus sp. APC 3903]MDN3460660.1 alpha/beta fold hydrolase [Rhodococcus sp. APC 3903]
MSFDRTVTGMVVEVPASPRRPGEAEKVVQAHREWARDRAGLVVIGSLGTGSAVDELDEALIPACGNVERAVNGNVQAAIATVINGRLVCREGEFETASGRGWGTRRFWRAAHSDGCTHTGFVIARASAMNEHQTIIIRTPHLTVRALSWGPSDGPLALLLHGFPDSATTWRHLGPELAAQGWRVIAPYNRGYAPSELPADDSYQLGALIGDVLDVYDAVGGDERAVLIGHDWGAAIASGVSSTTPQRFSSVVLLAVPPLPAVLSLFWPPKLRNVSVAARQLPRSWYMGIVQVPVLSQLFGERVIRLLWRLWAPGYDYRDDLDAAVAAMPDRNRRRAAFSYSARCGIRSTAAEHTHRCSGTHLRTPAYGRCTCTGRRTPAGSSRSAPTASRSFPREASPESFPAPGTSCTWKPRPRSAVRSPTSSESLDHNHRNTTPRIHKGQTMPRTSRELAAEELDPGPVSLRARDVSFDLSRSPLHWIPNHPVTSHVVSAYHMLFPEVERFFITAFEEALPLVDDVRLREDILGFIGQESIHADAHDKAVTTFLLAHGIDASPVLAQARWVLRKSMGPRDFKDPVAQRQYLIERLAIVAALENFTAFLGHYALNNTWDHYGADPDIVELLRWHGAEEMEHRNVAHDVALYFDPTYRRRLRAMAVTVPVTVLLSARCMWFVIKSDPNAPHSRLRTMREILRGGKLGLLPTVREVLGAMTGYLKPSYTPDDTGSMAQALDYLAQIDARTGAKP